jgi:hypothetical protein
VEVELVWWAGGEALVFLMRGNRGSRQRGVVDPCSQRVRERIEARAKKQRCKKQAFTVNDNLLVNR